MSEVNHSFTSDSNIENTTAYKLNKKKSEAGTFKISKASKNKNYHYLKKAYGSQNMPESLTKRTVPKDAHRELMLKQNRGHMNYIVCFPDSYQRRYDAKSHKVIIQRFYRYIEETSSISKIFILWFSINKAS